MVARCYDTGCHGNTRNTAKKGYVIFRGENYGKLSMSNSSWMVRWPTNSAGCSQVDKPDRGEGQHVAPWHRTGIYPLGHPGWLWQLDPYNKKNDKLLDGVFKHIQKVDLKMVDGGGWIGLFAMDSHLSKDLTKERHCRTYPFSALAMMLMKRWNLWSPALWITTLWGTTRAYPPTTRIGPNPQVTNSTDLVFPDIFDETLSWWIDPQKYQHISGTTNSGRHLGDCYDLDFHTNSVGKNKQSKIHKSWKWSNHPQRFQGVWCNQDWTSRLREGIKAHHPMIRG